MGKIEESLKFLDSARPMDLDDIQLMEKLRRRLNISRTEQYCGFLEMKGADCAYLQRTKDRFEEHDLQDIRRLVSSLAERLKRYGDG